MAGEINTQLSVVPQILPTLHADSVADLVYWTASDLVAWMDEGCKRVARIAGCFVELDTTITTAPATPTYELQDRQDTTLYVSFGTATPIPLRPAAMLDLEMRSPTFQTDAGTPDHWYEDGQGWSVGLTPVPTTSTPLAMVIAVWPPTLDTGLLNVLVQAPAPFGIYLMFYTLGKALGRESPAEMPDVAQHCEAICTLFEQIFDQYYGKGL